MYHTDRQTEDKHFKMAHLGRKMFDMPLKRYKLYEITFLKYQNRSRLRKLAKIPQIKGWSIWAGDKVEILSGAGRGEVGVVKTIAQERNSVLVEGMKMQKRHAVATQNEGGYMYEKEKLIHVSNIALVDPSTGYGCRHKVKVVDGEKQRISAQTGTLIPLPELKVKEMEEEAKELLVTNPVTDTPPELAVETTYEAIDWAEYGKGPLAELDDTYEGNLKRAPKWTQAMKEYRHVVDWKVLK